MRKLKLFIAIAILFHAAIARASSVLPLGDNRVWIEDVTIRNTTNATVSQETGRLTYTAANGSKTVIVTTSDIQAHATTVIADIGQSFDPGGRILALADGLDASAWLRFRSADACIPQFEISALSDALTQPGSGALFPRVRTDRTHDFNAFILVLNTGTAAAAMSARSTIDRYAADGTRIGSETFDEPFTAAPGLSLTAVQTQMPSGGTLGVYVGGAGLGGPTVAPLYAAAVLGTSDGGTQVVRYGVVP